MTEETVEVTIRTTPKGLQEMMASMPSLAVALQNAANTDGLPAGSQIVGDPGPEPGDRRNTFQPPEPEA